MGRAIYDTPKLIDQKSLNDFWKQPRNPDNEFYLRFREYLIEQTQLNGAFYGRSPWMYKYLHQKGDSSVELSETKTPH
jgi:capsular polysaccharide export protein